MKKILGLFLCSMIVSNTLAQRAIISRSSIDNRTRIVGQLPRDPEKVKAERFANQYGIPVREIDDQGRIKEIRRIENGRIPLYYKTHNIDASRTVSTDKVRDGGIEGLNLRGKNILVAVWDGGKIRTTHVEFGTRVYSLDSGFEIVGHATHVAGTIGAAGLEPNAIGMANQCYIEGYDWDNDNSEMRQAAKDGLLISNHSYGLIQGFDYNNTERRWEWHGDIEIDEEEDYNFGFYGEDARSWDDIAYDNPHYLIVKSAGNDRLEGPGAGAEHYVWDNGWKISNKVRDKDGGPDGFDCVGTQGTSKNILTVGAVMDIVKGYQTPEDVVITEFSTFGPTDDGRIKPDIVGNGDHLFSSYYESDNDYNYSSGTSMAAPNVAGSLALLLEFYYTKYDRFMNSSTLKGLVLHTADDAGNAGPDYKFGWGLLNTYKAAEFISNENKLLLEDSIVDQTSREYRFYAPGDSEVRLTICWTDPMGKVVKPSLDPKDIILVNDLDMRLIKLDDSSVYEPFILNPETPDAPAQTGDNFRDNIEQIYLPSLEKGYYDLKVSHKNSITGTVQNYSLIIEGVDKIFVADDSTYLNKNNGFLQVTDAPEYPLNRQFVWLIEPMNQLPVSLSFTEFDLGPNDTLTIYNGPGATSPVLARFSGFLSAPDTLLTSAGGSLFVKFSSGSHEGYKGFSSKYCTTVPEEEVVIIGKEYPCYNTTEAYAFEGLPESEYLWTLSENISDSASLENHTVEIMVPQDQFHMAVTPFNRCGTGGTSDYAITPVITPPIIDQIIEGDTVPCTNSASLFWVEEVPGASYRWILPDGWKGRSDSSSIWITPEKVSETIAVIPWNSCGDSEKIELSVNPTSLPRIPVIESEKISPCQNSEQLFHILAEEDVDYLWGVGPGWEIIGPDTLSQVLVKVGTGTAGRMYLKEFSVIPFTCSTRALVANFFNRGAG